MLSSDLMVATTLPSEYKEDSMHAMNLLEEWLQRNAVIGHRGRIQALVRVVGALLDGGKLTLTQLGRHRRGGAYVKHHIKAVDRVLGNRHLHGERHGVYRALAKTVLQGVERPVILVEWADSALEPKQFILKAAVPVKGHAISILRGSASDAPLQQRQDPSTISSAIALARISHRLRNLECDLCRTPLDEVLAADVRCTNAETGGDFADAQGPCGRWECETDVFRASRACAPLSVVPIVSDLFLANGGTTQAGAIEVPFVDWPVLWQRSRHRDKTGRRTATRGAR